MKCIPFLRNSRDSQSDVMLRIVIQTGLLHHEKQECYSLENARNIIKRAFNIIVPEKRTRIWSKFPAGSCLFSRLFSKLLESPPSASIKLHEHNSREQHAAVFECHKTVTEFPPRLYLGWKNHSLLGEGGKSLFPV